MSTRKHIDIMIKAGDQWWAFLGVPTNEQFDFYPPAYTDNNNNPKLANRDPKLAYLLFGYDYMQEEPGTLLEGKRTKFVDGKAIIELQIERGYELDESGLPKLPKDWKIATPWQDAPKDPKPGFRIPKDTTVEK
jgi:hypothetical protein